MRQVIQQQVVEPAALPQKATRPKAEQKGARADLPLPKQRGGRQPIEQALARAERTTQRDLLQALEVLQRENRALRVQLRIDHLTGVFNRLALVDELKSEWQRWQRSGRAAALLLIDLNNFKQINDNYGHAVGDRSLICAADYFAAQLRATDMVARLGGDEFAILLRDTGSAEAQRVAAKLCGNAPRIAISAAPMQLQLSFAIGVAVLAPPIDSVIAWLDSADQAMYRHKRGSRLHLCREQ